MIKGAGVVLILSAIAAGGLVVGLQGWRARGPDEDVVASMVRAAALVDRGHIPRRGNLTDQNSFRPPGTVWLLVPGVVLFDDPRLVEVASSALLYVAALAGVFMLARHLFSDRIAMIAVMLYAFSIFAIQFAGMMQPKAFPVFAVWMTYCAAQWVSRRDDRWLAAACVVCAAGMYTHLEMIPFLAIVPAIWWRYRPPVTWRPLVVAVALSLAMWTPYLLFQIERGFADLGSQLLLRTIDVRAPVVVPYCGEDPSPDTAWRPFEAISAGTVGSRLASAAEVALDSTSSRVPAGDLILLALTIAGIVIALDTRTTAAARAKRSRWRLGHETGVLALAILVPSVILLLLSDAGQARTLAVWPLQAVMIAAATDALSAGGAASRRWAWAAVPLVILIAATNVTTLDRLRNWRANGWSGTEPATIHASDFRQARCEDER
jgi:4-amino-4-deoxy-L-arabinose transferase-like glycosyltransferase